MIVFRSRLERERFVAGVMIRMYCRGLHGTRKGLCAACADLEAYAARRLKRCAYGEQKPACKKCPTHCYAPLPREQIRQVMRWAGPRMLIRHPLCALMHLLDSMASSRRLPAKASRLRRPPST